MLFLLIALISIVSLQDTPAASPQAGTAPQLSQTQTIKFEPTEGVPTFAVREPVLRVKPGTIVETRTFSKPGITTRRPVARGRVRSGRSTSKGPRRRTRWS